MRRFISVFAFVGLLFFAQAARAEAVVGSEAGEFVATTRDGKTFDLSALRGKVVLVNFWTTWCPACREELPIFEALWRQYHSQGLEMLAVNADAAETRKAVKQVAAYFTFPIAMMDTIKKNELSTVDWIPMTFVIGKDGKISNILSDPEAWTYKELRGEIQALLSVKVAPKEEAKPAPKAEEPKDEKNKGEKDKSEKK